MGFTKHRLDDFCEIIMGQAPSGEAYNFEGKGWRLIAGAGDFGEIYPKTKKYTTEASKISRYGDIILGIRASIGDKVLSDGEYCLGRGVACLRPRPELDSRYLWHWLDSIRAQLSSKSKGATFKQVNRSDISELDISLPPLEEQRRIAEILDRAQSLISQRRKAIAQLDTLTQAIFIEMFGDPVRNPKGWEIELFSSQIKSVRYGTGSPPDYVVEGIPFIRATNVKEGTIKSKDIKRISLEEATKLAKCKVSFGDLIVVRSGVNTGDCAMVSRKYHGAYAAFDLIVELPLINSVFYNFLINSSYGKSYLAPLTRRAAQAHLNAEQLRNLKFISPPMSLKEEFAHRVEAVENLKAAHRASLSELNALFASLQHRAFRGEL